MIKWSSLRQTRVNKWLTNPKDADGLLLKLGEYMRNGYTDGCLI